MTGELEPVNLVNQSRNSGLGRLPLTKWGQAFPGGVTRARRSPPQGVNGFVAKREEQGSFSTLHRT